MKFQMKTTLLALVIMLLAACKTDNKTYAVIETEHGIIKLELYDETPIHKENFIKLAKEGYYDGTLFHRVMNGFMIQGGDPDSKGAPAGKRLGMGGPAYQLQNEIGFPHFKGTLAAARNNNPEKKSSGSQFYIVHGRNVSDAQLDAQQKRFNFTYSEAQRAKYKEVGGAPMLDMDYTVFGEVVSGLAVVDSIAAVMVDPANRPTTDVAMKVRIVD